jgi:hypothetical protein
MVNVKGLLTGKHGAFSKYSYRRTEINLVDHILEDRCSDQVSLEDTTEMLFLGTTF